MSGHPNRNVARVTLGQAPETVVAYLKRELRVSWTTRLGNFLSGFGLVSGALREAQTLQDWSCRVMLPMPLCSSDVRPEGSWSCIR